MKQEGSTLTGRIGATGTVQNQQGAGNNVGRAIADGLPRDMRAVEWLVARSPLAVDQALQSLASSHNVALRVLYDSRTHHDANGNAVTTFYATGCRANGQTQDAELVADKIFGAMTPAPKGMIEGWLAELSVLAPRRKDDEFGGNLMIEAYSKRLGAFPADVVKDALIDHKWKFWPSWAELSDLCDSMSEVRGKMLAAVRALEKPIPEQETGTSTDHVAMKVAADEIMKSFGFGKDRTQTVNSAPMARTLQEAEERKLSARVPHWSETAAPDDPRWEMLRKSRIVAGMLKDIE